MFVNVPLVVVVTNYMPWDFTIRSTWGFRRCSSRRSGQFPEPQRVELSKRLSPTFVFCDMVVCANGKRLLMNVFIEHILNVKNRMG